MIPSTSRMQIDFIMSVNPSEYNKMKSQMLFSFRDRIMKTRNANTESVHDQWKIQHLNHVSKLSLVILIYLFNQDDGVISKKEKRIIKKVTRKSIQYLTYEEYMSMSDVIEKLPDVDFVISYINDHKMKEKTVKESISDIIVLIKDDEVYNNVLSILETKYIANI